ncbi:3-oxoacid CoA-transferase subunit B [Ensifer sp. NPDC090286]|uniref:3-oxoacid CoA-transferase subunit B n=1 Tax=Ensifer sp. NPDC090286 TaxID=3363991 RepID=UPI00383A7E20
MSATVLNRMLARAARELIDGQTVNLGIGLPTKVPSFLGPGITVCIHSENGIAGMGPKACCDQADRNLIDAGGNYVTAVAGTSYFDSATSFGLIRGGHLDLTILGAFEVACNGDLANWIIPGKFTPGMGGAMELAQKARRVVVLTTHMDKNGNPKLVERCSFPLTAVSCVDRIITDLAVIDVTPSGFLLRELAEGVSVEAVRAKTLAPLAIAEELETY